MLNHMPDVLAVQMSSVDIKVLADSNLTYENMVQEAENTSYRMICIMCDALEQNSNLQFALIAELIPRCGNHLAEFLTEVANEKLHKLGKLYMP